MTELIWHNGHISPLATATASFEDRGHQFADGVYEVIRVYRNSSGTGTAFTLAEHLVRLAKSAAAIRIDVPLPLERLASEVNTLIARSGLVDGMIYLQLTRGVAPRNHIIAPNTKPTLYFYTRELPPVAAPGTAVGTKLITVTDERWKRCYIKSIALLPNILAKNLAVEQGADEAIFMDGENVTECSASNLCLIHRGTLITAPVGPKVLPGITRDLLLSLAPAIGIPTQERYPTEYECKNADELFITSTTRELSWVSHWNNHQLHTRAGPLTNKLHHAYQEQVRKVCKSVAVA
jgi:D-alanine transaminase